jgi:hypothetical protein
LYGCGINTYGATGSANATKIMLNTGSTALPYEPYGYEIPISSGGKNLFDKDSTQYSAVGYMKDDGTFVENNNYGVSGYIQLSPNTQYTVSNMNVNGLYPAICFYTENKTFITGTKYNGATELIFTTPANCKYALVSYLATLKNNVMLNSGSTPLPYEPYNRITTPVYLGEAQTTRKVKKLVLDGNTSISPYSSGVTGIGFVMQGYRMLGKRILGISSHFCTQSTGAGSTIDGVTFGINNTTLYFTFSANSVNAYNLSDLASIRQYLAQQYANGTPVTVWYVLAEPETAVVNEPLMKIGDYADTLSTSIPCTAGENTLDVQTTVQPSEVTAEFSGWHPVQSVHERENGQWD